MNAFTFLKYGDCQCNTCKSTNVTITSKTDTEEYEYIDPYGRVCVSERVSATIVYYQCENCLESDSERI